MSKNTHIDPNGSKKGYRSFDGGGIVTVAIDREDAVNRKIKSILFNPAEKFGELPIGYAWGYSGSSCTELSRALCYDMNIMGKVDLLREAVIAFLPTMDRYPVQEYLITEAEIFQRVGR